MSAISEGCCGHLASRFHQDVSNPFKGRCGCLLFVFSRTERSAKRMATVAGRLLSHALSVLRRASCAFLSFALSHAEHSVQGVLRALKESLLTYRTCRSLASYFCHRYVDASRSLCGNHRMSKAPSDSFVPVERAGCQPTTAATRPCIGCTPIPVQFAIDHSLLGN